jgi:glycosyltransferase involved in cell wall biosynthesis
MANIASALSESDWEVHVLSPHPEQISEIGDDSEINYHYLHHSNPTSVPERILGSVRGFRRARNLVEEIDPDVILDDVSHFPYLPLYAPKLDVSSQNCVFLHTSYLGHTGDVTGFVEGSILESIERSLPHLQDPEIVCASRSTAKNIEKHTDHQKTRVLNPCIDTADLDYNYNPSSKTFMYLGRFSNRKNIDCLLSAWRTVETQYPEFTLKLAGDGPVRTEMEKKAEAMGLSQVEFLGFVDDETKADLLSESFGFVHPSRLEGYSTTGLEALASGCIVIGSDVPGIRDYISHEENGVLFQDDSEIDLAQQLVDVIENRSELEPMAETGRSTAADHQYSEFKTNVNQVFDAIAEEVRT